MSVMTGRERQYAEKHHALVYRFLYNKGLDINEYYDVVIFRYLGAVQRYLSKPMLRKYSFTTIAYSAMNSAVYHYRKAEKHRRTLCPITDTDYILTMLGTDPAEVERFGTAALLWAEVAAQLTDTERDIILRKANGSTNREIGNDYGLAASTISGRLRKIRSRLQPMFADRLKENI